jgi:5-enolpyruvylshikimate-3-phosphate synthase
VVASFAQGKTEMRGVKELRVKESDRIDAMAKGLRAAGVTVDEARIGGSFTGAALAMCRAASRSKAGSITASPCRFS